LSFYQLYIINNSQPFLGRDNFTIVNHKLKQHGIWQGNTGRIIRS